MSYPPLRGFGTQDFGTSTFGQFPERDITVTVGSGRQRSLTAGGRSRSLSASGRSRSLSARPQ